MKKVLAVSMSALLLLAGGCGGGETKEKVAITIGAPGGDSLTPMEIVDSFVTNTADKYDVTVDASSWSDVVQKIKLQMAAKNDVMTTFITDSLNAPSMSAQSALEDLAPRVEADLDTSLYSAALYAMKDEEGRLTGIPHGLNSLAVVYNKEVFDERGVEYPTENWTWQDMLDMAQKLTFDRDGDGKTDVYGICYTHDIAQGWLPFMAAVGVSPYKDGYRNSNLLDPKIEEAYNYFQQPYLNGSAPHPADISTYGSREVMFAEGRIAMYLALASGSGKISNLNQELDWDAQIMPIGWNGERTCVYVPNVWVMYSGATDAQKDAAWEFLKHFLCEESQLLVAEKGLGGLPIMRTALEVYGSTQAKPENKGAFYEGIDAHGMTLLENPCSSQANEVIKVLTSSVRDQVAPIPELIQQADADMQEELDFYYENL